MEKPYRSTTTAKQVNTQPNVSQATVRPVHSFRPSTRAINARKAFNRLPSLAVVPLSVYQGSAGEARNTAFGLGRGPPPLYNKGSSFITSPDRIMVANLEEHAVEMVKCPKGKVLFRQGDKGDAAYIVNSGAVGIYREVEGERVPLATLRKGELFGEMAVLDGSPRMATAVTLEPTTLMMISVDLMSEKMRKTDPFIKALITMLLNNLRSVHDSYTPRARSLVDSVATLRKQCDALTKFLMEQEDEELDSNVAVKVGELTTVVTELSDAANRFKDRERRSDALPPASPPDA